MIRIKHNKQNSFFDYRNVCYKCGNDVKEAKQYRQCPDKICQTKYCDKVGLLNYVRQFWRGMGFAKILRNLTFGGGGVCVFLRKMNYSNWSFQTRTNVH